ncbi:MAG: sugar phosphate isomerase/epimerase [Armatimonadetes bacterium]|nr:sugar phosphate isomerase/epimerase [Anaerolineae bacterium]
MLEFSCHAWAFDDLTLTEALGTIARLGFRYVDIGSGAHLNLVKAIADVRRVATDIQSDLRVYNLKLADVALLLPGISADDETMRRDEIEQFKALILLLKALGTPGVTLSPGALHPTDADAGYVHVVDALREMVDAAGDGLTVSIEPQPATMARNPNEALALLMDVPGLKLTVDWAQLTQQGSATEDIARLLPHTRHVHLRQTKRDHMQTVLEQGALKLPEVMAALTEARYTGILCVEYSRAPAFNHLRETVKLRDALRAARPS